MSDKSKKKQASSLSWSRFWRELWLLLKPFRRLMAWILTVTIIAGLFDLAKPYILKLVIDSLYNFQAIDFRFLLWLILLYLGSDQLRSLVQYFGNRSILSLLVK